MRAGCLYSTLSLQRILATSKPQAGHQAEAEAEHDAVTENDEVP